MKVLLKSITLDSDLQIRVTGINHEAVDDYASAIKRGDAFPPVTLFKVGKELFLVDGFHRFAAHRKAGESEIEAIVAVCDGEVVPPCGRCRELIRQVNKSNARTRILVARGRTAFLSELLPFEWQAKSGSSE